jgi:DNA-binding transcriptional LysR family regulator
MNEYLRKNEIVHVGIPPMVGTFLLPEITKQFSKLHPNVQLEIQEYGSQANQLAVESGEVDVSLTVLYNENKLPTLEYFTIDKTYLRLAVHKNSSLAKKDVITFEDIKDTPLILMNDETLQAKLVKEEFKKRNIKPNIRVRSNQIYTIASLIEQSHMAAFAFDKIFENNNEIILKPFDKEFEFEIVVCYRKDAILNKLTKEFVDFIFDSLAI